MATTPKISNKTELKKTASMKGKRTVSKKIAPRIAANHNETLASR